EVFTVPGNGEGWTLSVSGSAVVGTGAWSGEACCAGDLALTGRISDDSLHFDVRYFDGHAGADSTPRSTSHLDGVMTSATELDVVRSSAPQYTVRFRKVTSLDRLPR
ncbi:MAG TPA: hypothetical protein VF159_02220, partial [Gemmatimonadaceae bacterium]